uniref:Ig-like domain-containing protein n=1 Tax=Neolamprologus brichardi TaxID=32507 RepID=A0A3Q4N609_NEOBR
LNICLLTPFVFFSMLGALSAAGEDFFAKVGGKVTLKCGVSSYRRSLQWLHGNDLLHSNIFLFSVLGSVDLARRSVVRQTNLEISSVRETDAGRFTCSADGTRHEHSLSVFSVSVSVSPTADLLLGSEATLQCDVKGLIEGCEVKWRSPIVDSPEWSPTAQLNPVTSSHNGTWECIITCGSDQLSEHLTITVQGNTQILDMQTPVFHCDQKKNKHVFSFPEGAAQIQWFQDTVVGTGEDAEGETGVNHVLRDVRQNEQSNLSSSSSAIIILNLYCIQMFQCITLLQGDWIVPFPFIHHILVNCQSEQCGWN